MNEPERPPFGLYRVVGNRRYRGHEPGTEFTARLEPLAENRAVRRGDIVLLDRLEPIIRAGSYTLPHGWESPKEKAGRRLTTLGR